LAGVNTKICDTTIYYFYGTNLYRQEDKMKLYEVPNNTRIRVTGKIQSPPGAPVINVGDILEYHQLDGMYSYCLRGDEVVHLIAWADVEIVEGGEG